MGVLGVLGVVCDLLVQEERMQCVLGVFEE